MDDVAKYCPDALWQLSEPLIPEHPKRHQGGGRPRIDDRTALAAIFYVLQTGCAWDALPSSFGISTPSTHRRFTEWVEHGIFDALHRAVLDVLGAAGHIDWERASVDAMHVRAVKGGTSSGPAR